ncbi:putative hydrolase of the HAD superfamily [Balneicella halophila]|uniref:Putative hydrolase of the HAD superfamily n=1 Tax=Balneicella halophila TaxID=1537566 RepID=A0A7L4UPM8_BALHA|nr:YjjG family noncanonical pyrimidine nucleotidase [Balneicella halophila]PVX50837.1 putative hydrolase of the HAD superfamily [Balneicella halophila]
MKDIRHLFFDLDRTLWDFETNSETVLKMLYQDYNLQQFFPNFLLFHKKYKEINEGLWQKYYKKEITKDDIRCSRFYYIIGKDKKMCAEMSKQYVELSPLQTSVFPETHSVLHALKDRGYTLHIITNGFNEVQFKKLENSKLNDFFETVSTSENAFHHKPDIRAFEYALQCANTTAPKAAMIGDDLITDIQGAHNAGLFTVYFNPNRHTSEHPADKEIHELKSLLEIF